MQTITKHTVLSIECQQYNAGSSKALDVRTEEGNAFWLKQRAISRETFSIHVLNND